MIDTEAPCLNLWAVATVVAETPDREFPPRLRVIASSVGLLLVAIGAAWIIGAGTPHPRAEVGLVGTMVFAIGLSLFVSALSARTFRTFTRAGTGIASLGRTVLATFAVLFSLLTVIMGGAAFASSVNVELDPFWVSTHPARDAALATLVGAMSVGLLLLVSAAGEPQVSARSVRIKRVKWVQRCWLVAQTTVIVSAGATAFAAMKTSGDTWPSQFDYAAAILSVVVVLLGAVIAWHYRNRQFAAAERGELLSRITGAQAALEEGMHARHALAELQKAIRIDPSVARSLATPPLVAGELRIVIDALHAASSHGQVPEALARRRDLGVDEGHVVARTAELILNDPDALRGPGVTFLEGLRIRMLDGSAPNVATRLGWRA